MRSNKRKTFLICSCVVSAIFLLVAISPIIAEVDSTSTLDSAQNDSVRFVENQEESKATTASVNNQDKIGEESKEIIQAWVWRIVKRFQTAMDRIANISDRMESRLQKMEEEEANSKKVENAREKISKARYKIKSAGDNIILAAAEIKQVFDNTSPKKAFEKFDSYTQKSKIDIKQALTELKDGLDVMKSIKLKN